MLNGYRENMDAHVSQAEAEAAKTYLGIIMIKQQSETMKSSEITEWRKRIK